MPHENFKFQLPGNVSDMLAMSFRHLIYMFMLAVKANLYRGCNHVPL
jgi:hypothetical protein